MNFRSLEWRCSGVTRKSYGESLPRWLLEALLKKRQSMNGCERIASARMCLMLAACFPSQAVGIATEVSSKSDLSPNRSQMSFCCFQWSL